MSWNNPVNKPVPLRGMEPMPFFAQVQSYAPMVGYDTPPDPTGGRPTGNLTFFGRNSMPALRVAPDPTGGRGTGNQPIYANWGAWVKKPLYGALQF